MKFKIRILLLTLIFSGCEQEYPENFYDQKPQEKLASTESHHDFIQRISYRTASAEVLKKTSGFDKTKNLFRTSTPKNKIIEFKLDTNFVSKIEYVEREYLSYTFKLEVRDDSKGLIENLLVEHEKGKKRIYLISYQPDSHWTKGYLQGQKMPFNGKIIV